jgi:hypothetical protein
MTQIISVSIDNKQFLWLQDHKKYKDCSPTFLLRQAIHMKMQEIGEEYLEDIVELRKKVQRMSEHHQKAIDFISSKGVLDEFLE